MAQPVGMNARTLANKSGIESAVSATNKTRAVISPSAVTPCINRSISWKLVDFLGLSVKTCIPQKVSLLERIIYEKYIFTTK